MKKICVDKLENLWYSIPRRTGQAVHPYTQHQHHNTTGQDRQTKNTNGRKGENTMNEKKNANTTPAPVKDFEQVKRNFETALDSGKDYGPALLDLSTVFAYSVVNKCIDPQRKAAADRDSVSDNGQNPAMIALKRGIAFDRRTLDNTAAAANAATRCTLNKDGDPVTETVDRDAAAALAALVGETLSDGIDLVQTAAVALLEQAADHADGPGWLDKPYTVRRLSRKVYIKETDSAAYRDDTTTPAQEVYRAVRRAVQESRAVQTDPRNGYTYIEDLTADGLDVIYYRLQKYADLGGYAHNGQDGDRLPGSPAGFGQGGGHYTADRQTVTDYNAIMAKLNLTDRQAEVLRLRMQGKGYKAIATYLGVTQRAIAKTVEQVQKKAVAIGLTPAN